MSRPVAVIDAKLRRLAADLLDTMLDAGGLGLAAPQIGIPLRLAAVDFDPGKRDPRILVNPLITRRIGRKELKEEGCLSFPELRSQVKRSPRVIFRAQDLTGKMLEYDVEGLAARAVQHELDHLDGLLFVDKIGPSDKQSLRRELAEMELAYAELHPGDRP
jgi:peptide deformylase